MTCDHVGPDMDAYHYVNLPKDANTYDQQRYCKLRNCIVEAIAWYLQVLKSPDAPRNEKRTALRFVAHLVGDIHQPLHAGFAEDRGGTSVEVRFNGRKENLHSLWDTALVELEQGTPAEIAARIQNGISSEDRQQWQQGTAAEWALESLAVVRSQVYRLPASGEINANYIELARPMIRTRSKSVGARTGETQILSIGGVESCCFWIAMLLASCSGVSSSSGESRSRFFSVS